MIIWRDLWVVFSHPSLTHLVTLHVWPNGGNSQIEGGADAWDLKHWTGFLFEKIGNSAVAVCSWMSGSEHGMLPSSKLTVGP